jgi:hypothetical protein
MMPVLRFLGSANGCIPALHADLSSKNIGITTNDQCLTILTLNFIPKAR